ncbi:hypothetical protein ACQ4PT_024416 [Festuca glaucescens]
MPPPSLLSLLPAASVSPRTRRARHRAPASIPRLSVRSARAPSPLHSLPSSDVGVGGGDGGGEELHLLDKPFPSASSEAGDESQPEPAPAPSTEEVLASYLNFFQLKGADASEDTQSPSANAAVGFLEDGGAGAVVYYDPRPGDLVVGVVVGGDARVLDLDVGAGGDPALMLAKEAAPTSPDELGYLACDLASSDGGSEFAAQGRVGVAVGGGGVKVRRTGKGKCGPVVGVGTVVFAEVLGRTLGGRPLLSARRLFRRVAWHRVRQMKQLNAPIKVKIFEWNAGGLLTRIEGLRAFLPKAEMMSRPRNFTDLKNSVGREIHVCITKIDERSNELIISEKEAWAISYLSEGALLEGTVRKLFPYGAQIRIGETNRSGLLHVSKVTHGQLRSVSDVLQVGERVKALVIKSSAPDRIALSTKDLESEPGLFLSDKEKVFAEAEEMARRYRDQMLVSPRSAEAGSSCSDDHGVPFEDEGESYANWKWLKFIKSDRVGCSPGAAMGKSSRSALLLIVAVVLLLACETTSSIEVTAMTPWGRTGWSFAANHTLDSHDHYLQNYRDKLATQNHLMRAANPIMDRQPRVYRDVPARWMFHNISGWGTDMAVLLTRSDNGYLIGSQTRSGVWYAMKGNQHLILGSIPLSFGDSYAQLFGVKFRAHLELAKLTLGQTAFLQALHVCSQMFQGARSSSSSPMRSCHLWYANRYGSHRFAIE